jgi:hypothetical protein
MSEFDGVIQGIRELEAERTRYKKQLEKIAEIVLRHREERSTGFMVKAFLEIEGVLV